MKFDIELVHAEAVFEGFLALKRYRLRHSLYGGGMSGELMRERVERLRAVAVLMYDPRQDQVVLVEQFRIGALEDARGAWLLEIAGGIWDASLEAEQVARKEASEETSCRVGELLFIGDYWVSPGTSVERVRLYCGRVDAALAGGVHGLADEGEDIKSVVMTLDDALAALESGRIRAATAAIALQWLALHRSRVREQWLTDGG